MENKDARTNHVSCRTSVYPFDEPGPIIRAENKDAIARCESHRTSVYPFNEPDLELGLPVPVNAYSANHVYCTKRATYIS